MSLTVFILNSDIPSVAQPVCRGKKTIRSEMKKQTPEKDNHLLPGIEQVKEAIN